MNDNTSIIELVKGLQEMKVKLDAVPPFAHEVYGNGESHYLYEGLVKKNFPRIAQALLIAVEALEYFAEDERNPVLRDVPDHIARVKARKAVKALSRIRSL